MGNTLSIPPSSLSNRDIEDAESSIWLFASMHISILETQKQPIFECILDQNMYELDQKISNYIHELTFKHLTSESYHSVSIVLEKILKFGNLQKFSYRLMINMIKETIDFLDDLLHSIDGMMLEDIVSESELSSKCHIYCENLLIKYRNELLHANYPHNQTNIRVYNLHKIVNDQISNMIDNYILSIIDQIKGTILVEVDQLLCAAITSEIFVKPTDSESTEQFKKALLVIDQFMSLFDEGKEKLLLLPFQTNKRAIEVAIEEISYKVDMIIRHIQIIYSSDKNLLQQMALHLGPFENGIHYPAIGFKIDGNKENYRLISIPKLSSSSSSSSSAIMETMPILLNSTKKSRKRESSAVTSSSLPIYSNGGGGSSAESDVDSSVKKISRKKTQPNDTMADATPRKRRVMKTVDMEQ